MTRRDLAILVTMGAILATPFLPTSATAEQQSVKRVRVLVPDFRPVAREDKNFGKDLAKAIREAINDLDTHAAVSRDDIKDGLKRFGRKIEDMDCTMAIQLASRDNYGVVLCATYAAVGDGLEVRDIRFVDAVAGDEAFSVDPIMSARKQEADAAAQIVEEFALFVRQARRAVICGEYARSQQWGPALENCNIALEMNPEAVSVRYTRASVQRNLGNWQEALADVDWILAKNPVHENALSLGGFVAIQLGDTERALGYYRRLLQFDPANAAVRMRVAYDVAQEGDALAAMRLIEDGLEIDPDNIEFYKQHGNFAFSAAGHIKQQNRDEGAEEVTPEVEGLYRDAISSYQRVMESPGAEISASQIRNASAAYLQLGEAGASADFSRTGIELFPDESGIWMIHSDALREQGMNPEALAALEEVERLDPQARQLHLRMATLVIQDDRLEDAVPLLSRAIENGTAPDMAANMIFARAYRQFLAPSPKNYSRFIEVIQWAKGFKISNMARQTYDFWQGWSVYQLAIAAQEPATLATAQATLPRFKEAGDLFRASKAYIDTQKSVDYANLLDNVAQYIEIQELLIKRGGF